MKDIKLSSSNESRRGSTQRSWSLAEHVGDERLALQLAKEMVEREVPEEQVLPMPDIVPLVSMPIEEEMVQKETTDPVVGETKPGPSPVKKHHRNNNKIACQLVSIVLEQRLAEVELELQVPSNNHSVMNRPALSPFNARYAGGIGRSLRNQESLAWEYHQNPSCSFNIRLDPVNRSPIIATTTTTTASITTTNTSPSDVGQVRPAASEPLSLPHQYLPTALCPSKNLSGSSFSNIHIQSNDAWRFDFECFFFLLSPCAAHVFLYFNSTNRFNFPATSRIG